MITLESFKVLKRLKVTDLRIEPRKVSASYCVEKFSGESASYDLAYSYEKPYFDKHDPDDINLASMMLAQVAINYGLFFETIEFDGLFDKSDKQFIRDMTENTSREILTNKLLIRNEFLKPPFDTLQPEKRDKYTQAELLFTNSRYPDMKIRSGKAVTDKGKYAILSSGGKDSLLTYGIIKEIGEAYPVFINEAGRHWFTAVNAYRHYKETEANTEKPLVQQRPPVQLDAPANAFHKENYAGIRADIYPIRLWTVAVFLFGVLPIARKNGIGNILIGDEYDTTQKGNLSGISHYNGLYDQSRYFDNALTRYYGKKGWNIYQYSILRSLSEMLIMKTLIKRYPELQRHQVSCHAAHKSGEKMYPCGKCEKCRRIIGMIKALDEDPAVCGYTDEQIAYGLKALAGRSVKQIGSDAAQLYHALVEKNVIEKNEFTKKAARRHPEIMALRFDRERSRLEDLPRHIRVPLFAILRQYADGILQRVDGKWTPKDLNDTLLNETEYTYDER